jgi:acetyl-CoA carboxylase biotin carboxyl carrier protein
MKVKNGDKPLLRALIDFAVASDLEEVALEQGDKRIAFRRSAGARVAPATAAPSRPASAPAPRTVPAVTIIPSPMVGTFLRGPKDKGPLVSEGDDVALQQRVAVVEAMKVPRDVLSPLAGRILRVLVENGRPVEYGQPLFEMEPS